MDSESDDATDCNAKAGSSQSSDLCGVGSIGNSNNAPEIEETECGSNSEGLSVSGSSTTSCSTATTPPPSEMTPKGLCLLFYHHSGQFFYHYQILQGIHLKAQCNHGM